MIPTECSIILATYNRVDYLKKALLALLSLDFSNFEIIVVNDGSGDGTKEFLDALNNDKIKVIHHSVNLGLSASRNTGIKNACYEIVAFTDDDCLVEKNWLTELLQGFSDEKIGLVIGQTFYINQNYKGYFPERLVSNLGARWPMGCNIAYRRKVFDVCGYFDDFFFRYNNEDSEMAIRAVSRGFLVARRLEAIVYHQAVNWTIKSLLNSARNASVWPILKKRYPQHYLYFSPKIKFGIFVNIEDYFYIATFPIFIIFLFGRYLWHGKKDWKIFFIKWPVYLFLRRFYVYREALRQRVFIV